MGTVVPHAGAFRWPRRSGLVAGVVCVPVVVGAAVVNVLAARVLGPAGRGELAVAVQAAYLLTGMAVLGAALAMDTAPARRLWRPVLAAGQAVRPAHPEVFVHAMGAAVLVLVGTTSLAVGTAGSATPFPRVSCLALASLLAVCLVLVARPGGGWSAPRWRVAPAAVATVALLRVDRVLIPWLSSMGELGRYAAVVTMTEVLYWPVLHYVDANAPRWRTARPLRPGLVLAGASAYLVVSGVALVVLGRLVLVPLLGPEFAGADALLVPLVVAACCYGFSRVWLALAAPAHATGAVTSTEVTVGVATVVGCGLLVPASGAAGAALAAAVAYALGAVVAVCGRATPAGGY